MNAARYAELRAQLSTHCAAMLVKWLLCPAIQHSKSVAPGALNLGLVTFRGLTAEGEAFAVEHMRQYLAARDRG